MPRRNHRASAILRFPPELLAEIFEHLVSSCTSLPAADSPYPQLYWIPVTHVCRAWREAALQTPQLWTNVVSPPIEWGKEMMRRVKEAPFTFTLDHRSGGRKLGSGRDAIELLESAFKRPELIKAADISLSADVSMSEVSAHLTSPMPLLTSLRLIGRRPDMSHHFALSDAHRLRSLELSSCNIHLHSLRIDSLVELKLCSMNVSMPEILRTLTGAAKLQILHLQRLSLADMPVTKIILLPHLIDIKLQDGVSGLSLFRHITSPAIRSVQLICQGRDRYVHSEIVSSLVPVYAFLGLTSADSQLTQTLEISYELNSEPSLNLWNTPLVSDCPSREPLYLHLSGRIPTQDILQSLPLPALRTLNVRYVTPPSQSSQAMWIWVSVFKDSTTVEEIDVDNADEFITLAARHGVASFPALRRLIIQDEKTEPTDAFISQLTKWLLDREKQGKSLKMLKVSRLFTREQVEQLRPHVGTVIRSVVLGS